MTRTFTPGQQIRIEGLNNNYTVAIDMGTVVVAYASPHADTHSTALTAFPKSRIVDDSPKAVPGRRYQEIDNCKCVMIGLEDGRLGHMSSIYEFKPDTHKEIK